MTRTVRGGLGQYEFYFYIVQNKVGFNVRFCVNLGIERIMTGRKFAEWTVVIIRLQTNELRVLR